MKPNTRDINDSIMRCAVKTIALFGLGMKIYEGEATAPVSNTYSGLTGKELDPIVKQQNLVGEEQKPVEPVELYIIEELVNRYNAVKSAKDIKAQFDKMNWRDKFGNAITITKLESFFQKGWFNK